MNILAEEIITDSDAKEKLETRAKEIEPKYEQKNALEILRKFVKADPENIKLLVEELKKIEKIRERQAIAIANFLPQDKDDLKAILHKEYTSFTPEEIENILEIVKRTV